MTDLTNGRGAAQFYLLLILPMLVALNLVFTPFHAQDDYDHVKRAYMLEHGAILPVKHTGKRDGGYIDTGFLRLVEEQIPLAIVWSQPRFDLPLGITPHPAHDTNIQWSKNTAFSETGAAPYLPLVYLPQAAALWMGEHLNVSIYNSVFLARIANGATAVSIIAFLLTEMPFGVACVLFIFLLPKTLLQFASNSADPIMHALTLAVIVFSAKAAATGWVPRMKHYVLISLCLLIAAGARPPMLLLAALPLAAAWGQRNVRGAAMIAAAVMLVLLWSALVTHPDMSDPRCGASGTLTQKLVAFTIHGPILIAESLAKFCRYYFASFIGELGWGDGPDSRVNHLSIWIYGAAGALAGCAVAYDAGRPFNVPQRYRVLLSLCALGVLAGIFFVLYASCTEIGSSVVRGVQGRYFVGVFLLLTPAIAGLYCPIRPIERFYPLALILFSWGCFGTLIFDGLRLYWANI